MIGIVRRFYLLFPDEIRYFVVFVGRAVDQCEVEVTEKVEEDCQPQDGEAKAEQSLDWIVLK